MGPKPESGPQGAAEVVFNPGGTLTVTQGQTAWGPLPERAGEVVAGTSYNWTGAGSWRPSLGGKCGEAGVSHTVAGKDGSGRDAERGGAS